MILDGTLKPGERINQVQFAEKLNISRGPIREALMLLQNEGLIKHETNRGTFVTTLSKKDAYEIYTLRALLEGEAAQLALPNLKNVEFVRLEELLQEFKIALQEGDLEQEARTDIEFHQIIVQASKHQKLIHMHQQLDTQVGAMFFTVSSMVPQRASLTVEIHQKLLYALHSKDLELVKEEFSNHYINTLKDLSEIKTFV